MNMYGIRINRFQSSYTSNIYTRAFKSLSNKIYKKDLDILFSYGEIFVCEHTGLTYAEAANEYTNFDRDIENIKSIDVIKIVDINEVSVHPAYTWSDVLFYFVSSDSSLNDDYNKIMINSSLNWIEKGIEDALSIENEREVYEYDLNQIVFRKDLKGIEVVESIPNTEDIDVFEIINDLANKYDLLKIVK